MSSVGHFSFLVPASSLRTRTGDTEDIGRHVLSPLTKHSQYSCEEDTGSLGNGSDFCSSKSISSSIYDNSSAGTGSPLATDSFYPVQAGEITFESACLSNNTHGHGMENGNRGTLQEPSVKSPVNSLYAKAEQLLDLEQNDLMWYPPPPENEQDDIEGNFIQYDDDEDEIGVSRGLFSLADVGSPTLDKTKTNLERKEHLTNLVQEHFRALILQLLGGEAISAGNDGIKGEWLDIVAVLAWQAANFVKPETSRGSSMDPGDYVKVKCLASGNPCDSTLVRGVVCTKNVKHKRMTSQYRNPKLLLLGGALEYHRVPNQLASFDTLLQQEIDYLKMTIANIEAHRPNILLVEKSVSSRAQEFLLAKEISLVLNVKKPLLERIARCTGGHIVPSVDHLPSSRLGHCEVFRIERISEEFSLFGVTNKKTPKALMFFEGCPRRSGCTVLLRGSNLGELKKVKCVVKYAVFAAYHLSLEMSFLADEGASLPGVSLKSSVSLPEWLRFGCNSISLSPSVPASLIHHAAEVYSPSNSGNSQCTSDDAQYVETEGSPLELNGYKSDDKDLKLRADMENLCSSSLIVGEGSQEDLVPYNSAKETDQFVNFDYSLKDPEVESRECFHTTDSNRSILVSLSTRSILKGTVCERAQLCRIKFYGSFDKPLGRFLRDDLFNKGSYCHVCNAPAEAHVRCYTHQQGSLTIYVKDLTSFSLSGGCEGKIWMWHRCLRCSLRDGIPPASRRVVMSDAAWGLSFGKFLELSFSNHATANRIASCGHSLQKDCLRYYGLGSMVAFFRYSPIDVLSVQLPPSILKFNLENRCRWILDETIEVWKDVEFMHGEILYTLQNIEERAALLGFQFANIDCFSRGIAEFKDLLKQEKDEYEGMLRSGTSEGLTDSLEVDVFVLNRVRYCLHVDSCIWDRRLSLLSSLFLASEDDLILSGSKASTKHANSQSMTYLDGASDESLHLSEASSSDQEDEKQMCRRIFENGISELVPLVLSTLSDKIDSAWTGSNGGQVGKAISNSLILEMPWDNLNNRRVMAPARVRSFDSALRFRKGGGASLSRFLSVRSFPSSVNLGNSLQEYFSDPFHSYGQILPETSQNLNFVVGHTPISISLNSHMHGQGVRLLHPLSNSRDIVILIHDNEPSSVIAYSLCSKFHTDFVEGNETWLEGDCKVGGYSGSFDMHCTNWQFSFVDSDDVLSSSSGSCGSDDSPSRRSEFISNNKSPHVKISFEQDSVMPTEKFKFSVTCYFAKQFDALRRKCCPNEVDFVRSLSRCKRWNAQGGKSNVYFAKTFDERFIIKQVTKTELDSFEDFGPKYFKYLMDSFNSGSHTCLAKIFGIYQVTVKHFKGSKEVKMDLMVMENLFFGRQISRVYDLKGSSRSRYNSDTSGNNKVLLDLNLLETLCTNPMFLRTKAKQRLERAVWNDTSFLANVTVMDYSLLVGLDDEHKELVVGIIDFMRQYTWDKHLETWVKASGILGGSKNASPTVVSPKQYKKRFRKAMTAYFLTVPEEWP